MKIRAKLLVGFIIMALVTVTLGVIGIVSTYEYRDISTELEDLQIGNSNISQVLNAHYTWRQGLVETVMTGDEFKGSLDSATCALGTWLNSDEAKNLKDPELLSLMSQIAEPHKFIHDNAIYVMDDIEAGNLDEASEHLINDIFPTTAEVISLLGRMEARYAEIVDAKTAEGVSVATKMEIANIAFSIVAVFTCVFLAIYISNMISRPLVPFATYMKKAGTTGDLELRPEDIEVIGKYAKGKDEIGQAIHGASLFVEHVLGSAKKLESIADGDLTIDIKLLSEKDTMGKSMKKMNDGLSDMLRNIQCSTVEVTLESKQFADGASILAQGATEQAATIDMLSASVAEIAEQTKANATTADETAKLSATIKANAETGSRQMDDMIKAVSDINNASKDISKIIHTIDDIAFQTNILALNASVEAARAGAHGKGFAVVAEEVRNLAAKSAEAAKDTGEKIQNTIEKAELGARIAEETAASLKQIVTGISDSNQLVAEIAEASEKQNLGIEQINTGIEQVAQVITQNSSTAQESAAASQEMNHHSSRLEQQIAQFKVKQKQHDCGRSKAVGEPINLPTAEKEPWDIISIADQDDYYQSAVSGDSVKYTY